MATLFTTGYGKLYALINTFNGNHIGDQEPNKGNTTNDAHNEPNPVVLYKIGNAHDNACGSRQLSTDHVVKPAQGGQHKQHVNNDGTTAAIDIMIG